MASFVRGIPPEKRDRKPGTNGRLSCRWCWGDLTGRRTSYCSDACAHEFRLRSEPDYMRACVFVRDRGVCAKCGLDTVAAGGWQLPLALNVTPQGHDISNRTPVWQGYINRGSWEADHILPVVEGGGSCGLSNLRTLCLPCHREETSALN